MSKSLTDRDIAIFKYLHENKVASGKHLHQFIFKSASGTARRRLIKLRQIGMLAAISRDEDGDKSIVYSLTRKSFNLLQRIYPEDCLIKRYRSNSVDHDLRLLEIKNALQQKGLVSGYWPENILHSSARVQTNSRIIPFIDLQADAVIRLGRKVDEYFYCGIEYEASLKAQSEYARKIASIYLNENIEAILYVTKNLEIERRIKKTELEQAPGREKKIFFAQLEKVTNENSKITFASQGNNILEVY